MPPLRGANFVVLFLVSSRVGIHPAKHVPPNSLQGSSAWIMHFPWQSFGLLFRGQVSTVRSTEDAAEIAGMLSRLQEVVDDWCA